MHAVTTMRTSSATRWPAVLLIVGAGIVAALQVGKAAIAAPLLQNDLGIGLTAIGWLAGIFAAIGLAGGIATGALVGRFGARRVMITGLLVTVAAPSLLDRVVRPSDRDLAFSLWSCFMPVGMAAAMLAGPLFEDWRMMWWASSVLALAICLLVPLVVPGGEEGQPLSWRRLRRDTFAVLGAGGAVGLAVTFALYSLMFFAVFSFLPVLLMERLGVSHQTAGLLGALASAVNVIGNLAAGLLLTRGVGRPALLVTACLVMGLASLGIFLPVAPDAVAFGLCLLFSAVGGLIPATLLASAPIAAPAAGMVPIVLGLIVQGNNLGQILGPTAVGSALDRFGWQSAAYIVATAALVAAGVAIAASKGLRPDGAGNTGNTGNGK